MPPDPPAAAAAPHPAAAVHAEKTAAASEQGAAAPDLAGPAWRVIATPYTGEAHARGEGEGGSLALLACQPWPRAPARAHTPLSPSPGLAARVPLPRGTLIEASPCLAITPAEYAAHGAGVRALACYAFSDPARSGAHLLALGCGSLFNHNRTPNVDYRVDFKGATIRFYAARDVAEGEELTISYGRVWWDEEGKGGGGVPGAPGDPTHDHMDDEAAFLGAIGLGGEGDGDAE